MTAFWRILSAFILLFASPAWAADRAIFAPIGYSSDAHYFAFEEFGVHDGSGFAFSTIFVIDLGADAFVAGTPVRAEASDDRADAPLAENRGEAASRAAPILERYGVAVPAEYLVMLGDGVAGADGRSLSWSMPRCCTPGATDDAAFQLSLSTFPLARTAECDSQIAAPPVGFALSLKGRGAPREIHRDTALPKSRGCVEEYRLYAVVAPFDSSDGLVAIVSYYPRGFEGSDRRFVAIPVPP
jgi:predicted secreted protein